jgi:hypothetical protein
MPTSDTQHLEPHANGNLTAEHEGKEKSCQEIENQEGQNVPKPGRDADAVSIRERLKHFTWSWFTSTMGTGGLAIALGVTPHRFRGESIF